MKKTNKQTNMPPPSVVTLTCDVHWKILSWEETATMLFGHSEQEVARTSLLDYIHTTFSKLDSAPTLKDIIDNDKQHSADFVKFYGIGIHQNLTTFPVEIAIFEDCDINTYTVRITNLILTQKRKREQEKNADQLKIINHIYEISLEPCALKIRLGKILDHLLSIKNLNFLPSCAVFTLEQPPDVLSLRAGRGIFDDSQNSTSPSSENTSLYKKAITTETIQQTQQFQETQNNNPETSVSYRTYAVPIKKGSHNIGVFACSIEDKKKPFDNFISFLDSIANVLAIIIENQVTEQQLLNMVHKLSNSIVNLREEKKYSESIIQGLSHGLLVTDPKGIIQQSNTVAQSILKPFDTSLDYKKLKDIIGEKEATAILTPQTTGSQTPVPKELTLTNESGTKIILSYSTVSKENSQGEKTGMIVSFTEISEITYARREMEKMNRLSTMAEIASAVAHEVRNPLGGIKLLAQSIEEDSSSTDDQYECATRIVRQVDRLNELLTEFFSYARPAPPKKRLMSFASVFSEIKHLVRNKLAEKNIELKENLPTNLPPIIADPNQMQQVLLNLMLNAIDAVQQHGQITVMAQRLSEEKLATIKKQHPGLLSKPRYLHVIFADNGEGMDKETREKVFEPFFTTKSNGTGLGMSIVYRTVKENDAAITVTSKKGKGTSFSLYLPTR